MNDFGKKQESPPSKNSRVDFFLWRREKNFEASPVFGKGRLSFCVIIQKVTVSCRCPRFPPSRW